MQKPCELLRFYFEEFCNKRPSYSTGALARDLDISSSYISQVFLGKKFPSKKFVDEFSRVMNLSKSKTNSLRYSFIYHSLSEDLQDTMASLMSDLNVKALLSIEERVTQKILHKNWRSVALTELVKLKDFSLDCHWIASKLGTTPEEAQSILNGVLSEKILIPNSDGTYSKNTDQVHYKADANTAEQMRGFHISCLQKSIDHLLFNTSENDREIRSYLNITVPTNLNQVELTKELLLRVAEKANAVLDVPPYDEIYHLNIQLYPLGGTRE